MVERIVDEVKSPALASRTLASRASKNLHHESTTITGEELIIDRPIQDSTPRVLHETRADSSTERIASAFAMSGATESAVDESVMFTQTPAQEKVLAADTHEAGADLIEAQPPYRAETVFDDAVGETYNYLRQLAYGEGQELPAGQSAHETSAEQAPLLLKPTAESSTKNTFAEYVTAQTPPDASPNIEAILEHAADQPLQETLLQLGHHLAEFPDDTTTTELRTALKAFSEAVSSTDTGPATLEQRLVITPELTDKLLALLRAVGYRNPLEALTEFTAQHSLDFLLDAAEYLYQLLDDKNRQEFTATTVMSSAALNVDEPLTTRLGKAIVQYFFVHRTAAELSG